MTTPEGRSPNGRNGNLISFVTIGIAILAIGMAVFTMVGESSNAQILLLQDQQETEKETRVNALIQLRERLERIERRSVDADAALDTALQREIGLVIAEVIQRINDLDDALQKEFGGTLTAQAEDNIRERSDAEKHTNFEARLRVLEDKD